MASVGEIFVDLVNNMRPDLAEIYDGARTESLSDWKTRQNAMVTASGAASVSIPGLHLAGLAADVAFVLNRMGTASYGVGAIVGHQACADNILEEEDFSLILAYWADDEDVMQAMKGKAGADLSAKVSAKLAGKVLGKSSVKILTKTMISSATYLATQKVGGKLLAKPAAKFAAKFAAKGAAGFVPFLGAVVGGGVNLWLLNGIQDAAEEFYKDKITLADSLS
ncbi:MAG: hypothetical protein H2049_13190 [Porphyrobacter sp.]|nr:hypothetical protein [Porphyrobacter sp.]